MTTYNFYDTCSLLLRVDDLFWNPDEHIVISSITLEELECIKTSAKKDENIKHDARVLLRKLAAYRDKYEVWIFNESMLAPIIEKHLTITPDMKILATALDYDNRVHPDETVFITNDLSLFNIANLFFGEDSIQMIEEYNDDYTGYLEKIMDNDELAYFYEHPFENIYNLQINQYINIYNLDYELIDQLCWTGDGYRHVGSHVFSSNAFGDIKPIKNDPYQYLAMDSLKNNRITMIKGYPGSGKSILSLSYLFNQLEKGRINKIVIFCNTVAARGAAKLGYYPGSRSEKLMDSQIGSLLISKLGSVIEVERLIEEERIVLVPLADVRGYDTSGMKAGVYLSEAQNMDIYLMKLALQRIGEDSICIIDGDYSDQVDDPAFAGRQNGMRRVSKVFRGADIYGEVELRHIHRSKIAKIAEGL